jgi:hypothetical protein
MLLAHLSRFLQTMRSFLTQSLRLRSRLTTWPFLRHLQRWTGPSICCVSSTGLGRVRLPL